MKFATRQGEWHAEFNSKPGGDEDFPGILRDPTSTPSDSAVPFAGLDLHGSQSDEGWRGVLRSFSEGECRNSGWGRGTGGRCNAEWAGKRGDRAGSRVAKDAVLKTAVAEDACGERGVCGLRPLRVTAAGDRVAGLFPNEASVLRLVTAVLMETSEEWKTGRAYLNLTTQD